jgi:acyl-coenzyme A thioesterase PaaI-like protein
MLQYTALELQRYLSVRSALSGAGALADPPDTTLPLDSTDPGDPADEHTVVDRLEEDRLVLLRRARAEDLRPGRIWSGPAIITVIDTAGFLLTVAHLPPGSDAVTADLAVKFLRPAPFDDLHVDTRLLRMSKRSAFMDVVVTTSLAPDEPLVHATMTFVPRPASAR